MKSKRGEIGKIIVWIIIILIVLGVTFLSYKYMQSKSNSKEGIGQGENNIGKEPEIITIQEYINEKPPTPPE